MPTPLRPGRAVAVLALATMTLLHAEHLLADDRPPTRQAASPFGAALGLTRTTGAATVAVFTSRSNPASIDFWNALDQSPWARNNRGLVQLVKVVTEEEPNLVRAMGIVKLPTVKLYGRTEKGVVHLATINDCVTVESLTERFRLLDFGLAVTGKVDPAVSQAGHHGGDVYASMQGGPAWPQVQSPPQQTSPPVQMAPPQQPMMSFAPTFPQATSSTANVVQVPSQNLLIQQAAPQVFLAPQQSPVVYVPQGTSNAPMMMAVASAPTQPALVAAPAGNLFTTMPNMTSAPVAPSGVVMAAPTSAGSAAMMAPGAPAATLAVAASAPSAPVATLTNQTLSLQSSGNRTRVRVRGPGLLSASLSRLGERLVQLGRTRIETVQESTIEAPAAQSAPGGVTTISTTSASPVAAPPSTVVVPIQGPRQPQVIVPETCKPPCAHHDHGPNYPSPSPQRTP